MGKIDMPYVKFGTGNKNLVILPGISVKKVTTNASSLQRTFKPFVNDYKVYVFDRRQNIKTGYTVKNMAEDTIKVMQNIGIKNADFYGASQGGMISLYIALIAPDMVNKMVLLSSSSKNNNVFKAVYEEWKSHVLNNNTELLAESIVKNMFSSKFYTKYKSVLCAPIIDATPQELEHFMLQADACKDYNIYNNLKDIKKECLVVGALGDAVLGTEENEILAKSLNAEKIIYGAEYGHAVYDEAPDVIERVKEFLIK